VNLTSFKILMISIEEMCEITSFFQLCIMKFNSNEKKEKKHFFVKCHIMEVKWVVSRAARYLACDI